MHGSLAEGVLPGLLHDLYIGRETGRLRFSRGDESFAVRFRHGRIIVGEASPATWQLGACLVRQGQLSEADLARATEVVKHEGKQLGRVLGELGLLDAEQLPKALANHLREILAQIFGWQTGEYSFEPEEHEASLQGDVTLELATGEIVLEAVRHVRDAAVVRRCLGDVGRPLALSNDPLLRFQKIALSPADGFVLSRIDGSMSARAIIEMTPLPAEESERSLLRLLSTGIIEYQELAAARSPVTPPRPAPARPPAIRPEVHLPRPPVVTLPKVGPRAVPGPSPVPSDAETDAKLRRREVLEAHDGIKTRTHFEVLGVPRAASEQQIKEAYFRLAKRFHPDSCSHPDLADLRDKLDAVFIRLGQAYDVLRSPRTRVPYEEWLAFREPRPPVAPTHEPPAPTPGPPTRSAAATLVEAEKLIAAEKNWDAIQLLEPLLASADGKQRQRVRLVLARVYLKNPHWVHRAEVTLQKALDDDGNDFEAWFELAEIYRAGGLRSRAHKAYARVLELKPDHQPAGAAVLALEAELRPPTPAEPKPRAGLFKKLFGGE